MEKSKKSPNNLKIRARKIKAKLLSSYYGNPIKDMKLICVTGTAGKVEVAHYIHEILRADGQPVAVLATENEIKMSTLHKFFSDAWKSGANYVVVTAPAESVKEDVFHGLPISIAVLTNFIPGTTLDSLSVQEYLNDHTTLLRMNPEIVILNRDDAYYKDFSTISGIKGTVTYGSDRFSTVQILSSKLYKKGSEANLTIANNRFTVASFLPDEPAISYMAAAVAVANSLQVPTEKIIDGIANYNPEEN